MAALSTTPAAAARRGSGHPRSGAGGPLLAALLGALAVFLVTQEAHVLELPFLLDDYIFLDKARASSFGSVWSFEHLTLDWYRPWSRELHYWMLHRVFGPRAMPFHLANFVLWGAVLVAYFMFARRLAGPRVATLATLGAMVMAGWAVPLMWIAGVQDLWMLLFSMLALHALARGHAPWAALACALALISKETAVTLPAVALLYLIVIERLPWRDAVRRVAPMGIVVLAWAAVHPMVGGRLWRSVTPQTFPGVHPPIWEVAGRTLLSLVNLESVPAPERGWGVAVLRALPLLVSLPALAWIASRDAGKPAAAPRPAAATGTAPAKAARPGADLERVTRFGIGWALLAWSPLLMTRIGWHSYYALAGALGAWLVLGCWLARRPPLAVGLIAVMTVLRAGQVDTPSNDWGTEWFQRRAATFIEFMKADLMKRHPQLPPHSRLYFVSVPIGVGFMTDDAPALRVWYGDPTLSGGFYSNYQRRAATQPAGPDYFFRYDSTTGWVEIEAGEENLDSARARNPRWDSDHRELAGILARAEEWRTTASEYEKLAAAHPDSASFALNAGICHEMMGDSAAAARWYGRVLERPGATADARAFASGFEERRRTGR